MRRLELVDLVAESSVLSGSTLVVGDVDNRSSLPTPDVCGLPPPSDPLRLPPLHEASLGAVDTSYPSATAATDSVVQRRDDGAREGPNEW